MIHTSEKIFIACIGHNFEQHCQSKDLTETGKFVLQSAGVSSFVLGQIDQEIEFDDTVKEKNPTAYLFRRNFATMLYIELKHFSNPYEQKFIIPENTDPCTVIIDVQANAPGTDINIGIKSSPENEAVQYSVSGSMSPRKHLRVSSILKKVHHVYSSKRGKSLIESKATDEKEDKLS